MKIKTRNHTVHTLDIDGEEVELEFEPSYEGHVMAERVGNHLVVGYLSYDHNSRDIDDMLGDGMGKLYSFHRHASQDDHHAGLEALGNDRGGNANLDAVWDNHEDEAIKRYLATIRKEYKLGDVRVFLNNHDIRSWLEALEALTEDARGSAWGRVAFDKTMQIILEGMWDEPAYFPGDRDAQVLACYDHSGQTWSLSGGGMQCRFDTSNKAGVWVPDESLRECLDSEAPKSAWAFIENTSWIRGTGKKYQLKVVSWKEPGPNHVTLESVGFSDDHEELRKQRDAIVAFMPTPSTKHLAWARNNLASIYAEQFLETYNDVINGNVYNITIQVFDREDDEWVSRGDWEGCSGLVGDDHAMESLKSEFFNPEVEHLKTLESV